MAVGGGKGRGAGVTIVVGSSFIWGVGSGLIYGDDTTGVLTDCDTLSSVARPSPYKSMSSNVAILCYFLKLFVI